MPTVPSQPVKRGETLNLVRTSLRRLTHHLGRLNDTAGARIDLSPGDIEVLDMIGRDGPMSPRDITSSTGIHPATMTGILDRLERGGWISRTPDPDDRRRLIVEAGSERGREIARLYTPMNQALTQITSNYSDAELATIGEFLKRVADAGSEVNAQMRETRD
ncbi:MAG: MarR family transcriptional regulator [Acidimicrobiia bacterium]|nr:MarR family transcriptional regulator [Acidimicrobiia bacterium]